VEQAPSRSKTSEATRHATDGFVEGLNNRAITNQEDYAYAGDERSEIFYGLLS
jgi:hypothetical protein